jgi:hypothetical protein
LSTIGALFLAAMATAAASALASVNEPAAPGVAVVQQSEHLPRYSTHCDACGGASGVPFDRVQTHRADALIVLLAPPGSDLRRLNDDDRLSHALERAGLVVLVVESERELDQALNERSADIVLADGADSVLLRGRLAGVAAGPLVLAVVPGTGAAMTLAAKQCQVQAPAGKSRQFVKQVESFVSARQSGATPACESPG